MNLPPPPLELFRKFIRLEGVGVPMLPILIIMLAKNVNIPAQMHRAKPALPNWCPIPRNYSTPHLRRFLNFNPNIALPTLKKHT